MKRSIAIILAFTLLLGLTPLSGAAKPVEALPNVLLIIVDDLRPLVRAFGVSDVHTPHMDRLASEGTIFRRAYAAWPVCGPSRASFLSGLRPDTTGVYYIGQRLRSKVPDVLTLPEHFKNSGYHSISVGKVYHHRDEDLQAWSQPPWQVESSSDNWQGYASPETLEARMQSWREALEEDPDLSLSQINGPVLERTDLPDHAYRDGQIALRAVDEMRAHAHHPFFLAVGFVKPHLPFAAPQVYWDRYDPDDFILPEIPSRPQGTTEIPYIYSELHSYPDVQSGIPLGKDQLRELIHGYYASVSFIDAQVGRLLNELDRLKLRRNTLVALVGDHGFHLGEQGIWAKHSLFELSLHTPLIVSSVNRLGWGVAVDAPVEILDLAASLVELAGIEAGFSSDGESLVPLMQELHAARRPWALSQYQHFRDPFRQVMGYSLRTDRHRYTLWRHGSQGDKWFAKELYDLEGESTAVQGEQVNVAGSEAYAAIESELYLAASALAQGQP